MIWIQADDARRTAANISLHEELHGEIWRNRALLDGLIGRLRMFDQARLAEISARYQEATALEGMDKTEAAQAILEEILCDMRAGMNEFAAEEAQEQGWTRTMRDDVQRYVSVYDEATRGPPAEGEGEAKFSLEDVRIPTREELDAKPDMVVVDIRSNELRPDNYKEQRGIIESKAETSGLYREPYLNEDTGAQFFVTPNTLSHIYKNWGLDNIAASEHLPELIRTAVLTHAEESRKAPNDHTTGVYSFFAAVNTWQGVRPVKLTVKEYYLAGQDIPPGVKSYFENGNANSTYAQLYDGRVLLVEAIEKEEASSLAAPSIAERGPATDKHPSAPSFISVKELLDLVKGDAAKYVPQYDGKNPAAESNRDAEYLAAVEQGDMETAQRMVDEAERALKDSAIRGTDGRLMELLHGTPEEFYIFDLKGRGGKNGTAEGHGIYLTDSPEVSTHYGARQMHLYADIRHPAYAFKKRPSGRPIWSN